MCPLQAKDERLPFTMSIRSQDRQSGTPNEYTVKLPARPSGLYACTVKYLGPAVAGPRILQFKWSNSGVNNISSADRGYTDVLTYTDELEATGTVYMLNCPAELSVRHTENLDVSEATTSDMSEHMIWVQAVPV